MLRISTPTLFQRGINSMLEQQAKLSYTQEQIASGKKILSPADDPAASAQLLELGRAIATVNQYQENAGRAQSRLEVEEVAISSVAGALQRVRELAVQGGAGTFTPAQRASMAVEVREMQAHILSQANTKDSNGEYIFSGFQGRVQPFTELGGVYTYHGDMGRRELQISADRTLADRDSGFAVFMDVPTSAGGAQNMFAMMEQIAVDLEAGTAPTAPLADVDEAIAHLAQVLASIGGRLKSIDEQTEVNADFITTMEISRANIGELDYAEAITRFSQQQVALEAAQKSFAQIQGMSLFNFIN